VLWPGETSFEYEREVQPRPKLGRWTKSFEALLARTGPKTLTLIHVFEELRGSR